MTYGYDPSGYDPGGIDQIPGDLASAEQNWILRFLAGLGIGLALSGLIRRRSGPRIMQRSAASTVAGLAGIVLIIAAVALALTAHKMPGLPPATVEILFWPGAGLLLMARRGLRTPGIRLPRGGPAMPAPPPSGGLPYPSPSGPVQPWQPSRPAPEPQPFYDYDAMLAQSRIRLQQFAEQFRGQRPQ